MDKPKFSAYVAWIAVCIIWGTTYLAIRIGVAELPPMLFAGVRWITAGGILLILLNLRGHSLPRIKDIKKLAIVGILLLGAANGLVVVAEQWLPSGLTALILSTLPFWMVGLEFISDKGPNINWTIVIGLLLGIVGTVIIFTKDLNVLVDFNVFLGGICLLGAVISWSVGSIYWKYKHVDVNPFMGASVQMLIAGLLQTLLGFLLEEHKVFQLTQNGFLALGYLIVFGSIFGYASYIYAVKHMPLSLVSTYAYINPVIALILGWYILNEPLTITVFIAAALIFSGVLLVKRGSAIAASRS
jgi:drug/metabolite transporter (DMT)-like permease